MIRAGYRTVCSLQKPAFGRCYSSGGAPLDHIWRTGDLAEYRQCEPHPDDEIVVAMSSGVDSSVCAALFAEKYRNVKGMYMANWSQTARCTEKDWNDVQRVCDQIKIPCERVNFEKEYWMDVFEPMIQMYRQGLTPNPDVNCNRYIKFGKMIEHLDRHYSSPRDPGKKWWLATGHYARILQHKESQETHLLRGLYLPKDQSYYLSTVPASILPRLLLPLGHTTKPKVRQIAKELGLLTSEKPDSQGLCFVSQTGSFRDFLNDYIERNPGNIVTKEGRVCGKHQGLWHATIGQRAGVSMPQGDPKYNGVWYVSEKRYDTNEIVIVKGRENPDLFVKKVGVQSNNWHWMGDNLNFDNIFEKYHSITAQYRSLQDEIKVASVESSRDGTVIVEFDQPARAVAPGQSLVLYGDFNRILGCGTIVPL